MSDINNDDKKKLFSFFSNIKKEMADTHLNWKDKTNNHILIVDSNNLFLRGYCSSVSISGNGDLSGGVIHSLKSLGSAIKMLNPSRIVMVFDGIGGSKKRKAIYPDYKAHSANHIRLNRVYDENATTENEDENKQKQYLQFINYLQTLPLNIVSENYVEADDVIAYLATDYFKSSKKVTIFSSDRDFLQLVDDRIQVYSATKKQVYGVSQVLTEYNIHPNNFALMKSIIGDNSDNINGIERAGNKTVVKHFPYLKEEKIHTIDEIVTHATDMRNKYVVCENIANGKSILERNYALMQLKDTSLGVTAQLHLQEVLAENKIPKMDRNAFYKLIRDDRLTNNMPDYVSWINLFDYCNNVVREGKE